VVVDRVAVQLHHAHVDQRILPVRPDLGQVEGVEAEALDLVLRHDLDLDIPFRILAALDGVEEIALRVVRVAAGQLAGALGRQVADALRGLEVPLHVEELVVRVDQREGMAGVAVHVAIAVRRAAVAHQERDLVQRLGRERPEVPHHGRGLQVRLRAALLGVDEVAELERIADEEDRRVVADHVPVALLGVELHREAAGIAGRVGRSLLSAHGREADEELALVAHLREELGRGVAGDVVGDGEATVGARALGMHDTLRHPLAVEVGHLLEEQIVLHQDRPARTGRHGVLVVAHRTAARGRHLRRRLRVFLRPDRRGAVAGFVCHGVHSTEKFVKE